MIPSPPPVYNFARIPAVYSRDAWWATKHPERMHLDPIEVEEQGGRELPTCCRLGEFGPGNDGADRGECRVVPDELGPCE